MVTKCVLFIKKYWYLLSTVYILPLIDVILRDIKSSGFANKKTFSHQKSENTIPKIIHVVWDSKDIPPKYSQNISSILEFHKDWELIIWTHEEMENYVKNKETFYYSFYKNLAYPIQQWDFFKIFVMYKIGGVYFDVDVTIYKSFNSLLHNTKIFFPCEKIISQKQLGESGDRDALRIGNYAFGSTPNHPFLFHFLKVMMEMSKNESDYNDFNKYILNSTGPGLLTPCYHDFIRNNPDEEITILYPPLFTKSSCSCGSYKFVTPCCIGSYGVHHHHGTWRV